MKQTLFSAGMGKEYYYEELALSIAIATTAGLMLVSLTISFLGRGNDQANSTGDQLLDSRERVESTPAAEKGNVFLSNGFVR